MSHPEPEFAPNIACIASLIGEPARAAMLWSLVGGETRPAGELARIAGVSPQAASAHLSQLVGGGLLDAEAHGRHRFFRLSSAEAAMTIENLAALSTVARRDARSVPESLRRARRCWGHLAGELGVELHDALWRAGWFIPDQKNYALTAAGHAGFSKLGIDVAGVKAGRRGLLFPCLDWSERRSHLGGPLARKLLGTLVEKGYLQTSRSSRLLTLTPSGASWFADNSQSTASPTR